MQEEHGINVYDFHARNYMPVIGRTTTLDPLAEKFYSLSPYSFFNNNPVYFIDLDGMASKDHAHQGNKGGVNSVTYQGALAQVAFMQFRNDYIAAHGNQSSEDENDSGGEKGKKSKSPSSIIGGSFGNWSKSDKEWFKNNPNEAIVIKAAAAKAGAKELFSNGTIQNNGGYGDALRHTYWMYLITKELGPEIARQFGIHHENQLFRNSEGIQVNNLDSPWGRMDLHNNEWGINFALKNLSLDFEKSFQYYFDNAVMSNEIIILNQNTIPNITKKRENYEKAKQWALSYGPRE